MPEHDRDTLKQRLRALLERHQGPEHCITMTALHHAVTGETVIPWKRYDQSRLTRALVEELRREGAPIAHRAGGRGGYFWARSDAELADTVAWFHARALASLRQEAALKRIGLDALCAQLQMELATTESPA